MKKLALILALVALASGAAFSQEVTFQFLGGFTLVQGDDYNKGVIGENSYLQDMSASLSREVISHCGAGRWGSSRSSPTGDPG